MNDAVIIHAGTPRPPGTKSLAEAGKGLGLTGTFAAPHAETESFALLVRHVDELKFKLALIERELHELRMPLWRKLIRWWVRA